MSGREVRSVRRWISVAAVIVVTVAGCRGPEPAPEAQVVAGPPLLTELGGFRPTPWQPLVAVAPVAAPDAPMEERLAALEELGRLVRSVTVGFARTPRAHTLWERVVRSLGSLDIEGLFQLGRPESSLARVGGGWRAMRFRGGRRGDAFLVDAEHAAEDERQPGAGSEGPGADVLQADLDAVADLGRMHAAVALRPAPADETGSVYQSAVGLEVELGGMRSDALPVAIDRFLAEADVADRFGPDDIPITDRALAAVKKRFPALDGDSAALTAEALRAFPHFGETLGWLVTPQRLIARHRTAGAGDDPSAPDAWTEVDAVFRLERERLEVAYPLLSEFLEDVEDLLEVRQRVLDADGNEVVRVELETFGFTARVRCVLAGGRLVPVHPATGPVWERAIDPFAPSGRFTLEGRMALHLAGVDLVIDGIPWTAQYERRHGYAGVRAVLRQPPRIEATGALLGIVPVWFLDLLIPGNLEELAASFFDRLTGSREGRGALGEVALLPGALSSRFSARGEADLEDAGFVSFMMRLTSRRFLPDPDVQDEWRRLAARLSRALAADERILRAHQGLPVGREPRP
jgi:hypothetical protein